MRPLSLLLALSVAVVTAVVAIAQDVGPQAPPLVIRSIDGRDSFEFYCAPCHGRDGGGHGALVERLKTKPPDLRRLAQRNGGDFPRDRVLAFVTSGDPSTSEHRSEMPPWGEAFAGLERSEILVTIRISNIVRYLESLQIR